MHIEMYIGFFRMYILKIVKCTYNVRWMYINYNVHSMCIVKKKQLRMQLYIFLMHIQMHIEGAFNAHSSCISVAFF